MKISSYLPPIVFALLLAGCANLETVNRRSHLPNEGLAVHLDAPQRLAVANKKGWVCAEPSPDALQAYASSLGLGFDTASKNSAALSQALAASAGSIGLRTQSITLMRDALYRICELYFNGAISRDGAVQLLERSQELTLGILAIEQLTGAVVAQQVVLNSSSTANAAAAINDTQKELDKAKADEAAKQAASDKAAAALETQKKDVSDKTADFDKAKEGAKETQAKLDSLQKPLIAAQDAMQKAISTRIDDGLKVVDLEQQVKFLTKQLGDLKKEVPLLDKGVKDAQSALDEAKKPDPQDKDKVSKLQAALDKAKADQQAVAEATQKTQKDLDDTNTVLAAQKQLVDGKDRTAVDIAQNNLDSLNNQIASLRKDPKQAAAVLAKAVDDQKKKQAAAGDAKSALQTAQANTKEIQKLGDAASASSSAGANSAGTFSSTSNHYGVAKDTVEVLAKATTDIVQAVLTKGHLTDSCSVMLMTYLSDSARAKKENAQAVEAALDKLMPICKEVISTTLAVYRINASQVASSQSPASSPAAREASTKPKVSEPLY